MAKAKKNFSKRWLRVLSRHPSHDCIRLKNNGILCDKLAVVRFGSTTPSGCDIQINSIESIKNSSNKLRMKKCFDAANVNTTKWLTGVFVNTEDGISKDDVELSFPLVAKKFFGSRGEGNTLIQNKAELDTFIASAKYDINNILFEQYYNYSREYRLHVTNDGCFYACRKMLKANAEERWYKNDSNCVWFLESNPDFNKPVTWNSIVDDCVKALNSVGLDVGACDVIVNKKGEFKVLEINSAPAFAEITAEKYREILPVLVNKKAVAI